jgi:hypothetical protein
MRTHAYTCFQELGIFLRKLGNDWEDERIKQVYGSIEKNSRKLVDFSSFYAWYSKEMKASTEGDDTIQVTQCMHVCITLLFER